MTFEVTLLDAAAPVVVSSPAPQPAGRRGRVPRHGGGDGRGPGRDPRKAADLAADRVLQPRVHTGRATTARCSATGAPNSGMTLAVAADHIDRDRATSTRARRPDRGRHRQERRSGSTPSRASRSRSTKIVSYHTSRGVPARELVDRCRRTLDRVRGEGVEKQFAEQRGWLDGFWDALATSRSRATPARAAGDPVEPLPARARRRRAPRATGVPAKGVTGSGYDGHYFWDTEIYVLPFLTYTSPALARNALRFRYTHAAGRAAARRELNQRGALFPWRTINGEEASAYYAAGTAQYHIDADIALCADASTSHATGDAEFLAREAIDILVETARLWADLGFWRGDGDATTLPHPRRHRARRVHHRRQRQPVHERHGALQPALAPSRAVRRLAPTSRPDDYARMVDRLGLDRGRGRRVGAGRRGDAHPLRREPRHPPAGRRLPRARGVGPGATPRRTSARCCCTTTRW